MAIKVFHKIKSAHDGDGLGFGAGGDSGLGDFDAPAFEIAKTLLDEHGAKNPDGDVVGLCAIPDLLLGSCVNWRGEEDLFHGWSV
jgi:hypothetical protein